MKLSICFLFFFLPFFAHAQWNITTIAGNGIQGYSGDNGPATAAELYQPCDLIVDDSGNVYISDFLNACIRKIDKNGIITTIAGVAGHFGYNGDSIMATDALLDNVLGIAVDKNGNVYLADHPLNRIRKISTSGIITTIAGTGIAGYNGDGIPATAAQLYWPDDVAVDKYGCIYICDGENNRIRKIDTFGIIHTIAGTGSLGLSGDGGSALMADLFRPNTICVDTSENVYFANSGSRIRKVDTFGIINTIAGNGSNTFSGDGGPASLAGLEADGLACDKFGDIFFADYYNRRIRKINVAGIITTVAGKDSITGPIGDGGPATSAIIFPTGVAVDSLGAIYIADELHMRIRKTYMHTDGIDAMPDEIHVNIYPNPSSGKFIIDYSIPNNIVSVTMYNIFGQEVGVVSVMHDKYSSITTDVPDGVYYLFIITNKETISRKIVIKR